MKDMSMYLSRLTLNPAASAKTLMPLLNPVDPSQAADAHHRLVWSVFSDSHKRTRDFLWRYEGDGRFMALSARPPVGCNLFLPPETKTFCPDLRSGDSLHFLLRANATRVRKQAHGRSVRVDVVMDRLHDLSPAERTVQRPALMQTAARDWMALQGTRNGFEAARVVAEGYTTLELGRKRRQGATLGLLDLSGQINVTDPVHFLSALARGFGRAKAWGCGLMLIRRV